MASSVNIIKHFEEQQLESAIKAIKAIKASEAIEAIEAIKL